MKNNNENYIILNKITPSHNNKSIKEILSKKHNINQSNMSFKNKALNKKCHRVNRLEREMQIQFIVVRPNPTYI